ncbi:hypothetical protein [Arthrobacter cupressi]|uniref:Uncharacterized protein n=1 Tax=Arthrobacter cupressi TaxID=1045773 RepID=A0A1G8VMY7_9MICC|nr:hypothetical protein [Arthrobacter cupressi]NYD79515.1 hypothetical protein [Arthrobacter cupressi]SDJ67438.1 hypothetical protein SAMN05216555_11490 [Arthrobacter cupressi]
MQTKQRGSLFRPAAAAIAGTVVWFAGITPAQRVYTTRDAALRLAILERSGPRWVAGQHVAAMGTAAVPVAYAALARGLPQGKARGLAGTAAAALLAGAPMFIWCLADRGSDLERFAYRRGAGWPFAFYAWSHVAALAALAGAFAALPAPRPTRTALALAGTSAASAAVLAATGDIPPFVFYLAEGAAAAVLLRRTADDGGDA